MDSVTGTGVVISLVFIALLALFGPNIRHAYLSARNRMREAALRRRSKASGQRLKAQTP
jgi:hypothetical protein